MSTTTAKVMKEKTISVESHYMAMLYNKLPKNDENIVSYHKCSFHLYKISKIIDHRPNWIGWMFRYNIVKDKFSYTSQSSNRVPRIISRCCTWWDTFKVKNSAYFVFSCDESTDSANHKKADDVCGLLR
jgi:hypothetical protein